MGYDVLVVKNKINKIDQNIEIASTYEVDVKTGGLKAVPTIGENLPGNYRIIAGYSNKEIPRFDIDPRHLIGEIIGVVPVAEESDNYALKGENGVSPP